jgi:predicted type IV restriction endonuclease
MYAVNEGVEWLILTNGDNWQLYHLTFSQPVVIDPVLDVSLTGEETPTQKASKLFYLTRESLKRRQVDELWKARLATSPRAVGEVILSEAVATAIRRELWRRRGHRIDDAEVVKLVRETVLRPECFE